MKIRSRALFLILSSLFVLTYLNFAAAQDELAQIKRAITGKNAGWTAGENWVTKLPPEERKELYGALPETRRLAKADLISLPEIAGLPEKFDWRDHNGNWVTPVRNQKLCGSCWDFSAVAQIEAWWKIHNANQDSMIDLSEQFLLSCGDAGSCNGGHAPDALEFVKMMGIPLESCLPYSADDTVPCDSVCDDWRSHAVKIPGWGYITSKEDIIENIKNAVYRHPVSASYTVYEDFSYYDGGVYEHVWGDRKGGHAILIVGWNDEEQSWICKNSWGEYWGEDGYFRIKWGSCGIGKNMPFIWDSMTGGDAISIAQNEVNATVRSGEVKLEEITISNTGAESVEFSAIDYEVPVVFHPDTFQAWEGKSWWCADPQLGGYENHWLQYLDTPILDLRNRISAKLTYMGAWLIEDPAGTIAPWDGWDGANVWISVNGGETFDVISPVSPAYNCRSLWSFGHSKQGWNFGAGIPGWGGNSKGWQPVEYDLSGFKSDSVIIRFAFASDLGFCTEDDSSMYGLQIDNIFVTDATDTIFKDFADDIFSMHRTGFGEREADWIVLENGAGVIAPQQSAVVNVKIDATDLSAGDYSGLIKINSNDFSNAQIEIPISVRVETPVGVQQDESVIPEHCRLAQNYPNPFNPVTTIEFDVREYSHVRLQVFTLLGEVVATPLDAMMQPGTHRVRFTAENLSSGIYFYQITAKDFKATKRLLLLK